MNNLVDYGPDTDEELELESSPPPPQDQSKAVERRRSPDSTNFNVPRSLAVNSSNIKVSRSQSSLLAYGEKDVMDGFDEDFERHERPSASGSGLVEPCPPRRLSHANDASDDRSPDETDIDMALEEGLNALKSMSNLGDESREPDTPKSDKMDSGTEDPTIKPSAKRKIEMPLSPPGACDPEIETKFLEFFEKKSRGMPMNETIKKNKHFKNPAIYEFLVDKFKIDEKGSNFGKEIFNPHSFNESDFYDALGERQRQIQEKLTSTESKKTHSSTHAVSSANDTKQRKSRFGHN